jgi:C-terminal processing protease CtpA/Prc
MTQKFKERVSSLMQEKEQEQQAAAEQRRSQFQSVGSVDEDDDEDYDDEDDYSDFDEDDETTLGGRADADDKVFEVIIVRNESTGSLGLELDEYKGSPTVCAIMLGGPADQDGTLQMGDTVVAIDGKPTHNMEDVKRAVISAASTSLRLAVLRKPVVVLRRERAYT